MNHFLFILLFVGAHHLEYPNPKPSFVASGSRVFSERDLRKPLHRHLEDFEHPIKVQIGEYIVTVHTDGVKCPRKSQRIYGHSEKWAPVSCSFEYHPKIPAT